MQSLKPDDISDFLERFQTFYDAVLGEFSCQPPRAERNETSCTIVFQAKDLNAASGWSLVTVHLKNVTSWKFAASLNCAYFIMSGGVHIFHEDDLFYMDVGNLEKGADKVNDYISSDFHFVARSISWDATEII